jgi:hypothetical protein
MSEQADFKIEAYGIVTPPPEVEDELDAIDQKLKEGWVPPARPVEDVVSELRAKYVGDD